MNRLVSGKFILAWVLLASLLSLLAFASPAVAGTTMDRINESGVLRVGVTGGQPPLNMKTKSGEIIGMEVDLARALAASMGVKVQFVAKDFASLLTAVEKGDVDIALSGVTMTAKRNRKVAFAGPYFVSGKGLITTSASLAKADDPSDIGAGTFTLVALKGSTSYDLLKKAAASNSKVVPVKDYDEGIEMVISGKADAMLADYPICLVAALQNPDAGIQGVIAPLTFEPLGGAVSGDDALFLNLVDNYFDALEGTGLMEMLRAKWFENGSWLAELP
jgi:polar amino acid transport system substrate-binding protein